MIAAPLGGYGGMGDQAQRHLFNAQPPFAFHHVRVAAPGFLTPVSLQHLRQLGAPCAAWIVHIASTLLCAVGGDFI